MSHLSPCSPPQVTLNQWTIDRARSPQRMDDRHDKTSHCANLLLCYGTCVDRGELSCLVLSRRSPICRGDRIFYSGLDLRDGFPPSVRTRGEGDQNIFRVTRDNCEKCRFFFCETCSKLQYAFLWFSSERSEREENFEGFSHEINMSRKNHTHPHPNSKVCKISQYRRGRNVKLVLTLKGGRENPAQDRSLTGLVLPVRVSMDLGG